ncbi:MAG: tagaturonate reductase [Flavobacteriaceae bacterium]
MQVLNRTTAYKTKIRPLKIMQFGGGNFLRAFVDYMVEILNDETDFNGDIVVVKPTEHGDYSALKSQDGLFHVVLDGIMDKKPVIEKRLVSSVAQIINAYTEWEDYLALAKNPTLRFIVSNTTEAGIKFNPQDRFDDAPPEEFPAKLTFWLYQRFEHFKGDPAKGCILLPCELIEDNGATLKKTVLQYAAHWNLPEAFIHWIQTANYFCGTLVDRIVSGYPSDRALSIQSELGYEDKLLVAGEYYHSWVIQGPAFVAEELPFSKTTLNVSFVDDLVPYREMKVRILNGAHTAMVPMAYLAGCRLVSEAMEDYVIRSFVTSLLLEETITTLNFTESVLQKFVNDVLDRFKNPVLKHQLISISLNTTTKFVARLLPTLKDYQRQQGTLPKRIVLGLACLIRFYKGEFNGEPIPVNDNPEVVKFFREAWQNAVGPDYPLETMVQYILKNTAIWGEDLTSIKGLREMVTWYLMSIENNGIEQTIETVLKKA